ncbi:hypothetical protein GCM10010347_58920 [Streptomyces cirratus]|uniref:Secreted protein n=1 Tax=Streptomyces cirratus TaxID=68187 RepID=A0ABQ3F3W5_9ACTN|nr:hypothetical protein GCM10010347_58920 [Streptomyces cirratus]
MSGAYRWQTLLAALIAAAAAIVAAVLSGQSDGGGRPNRSEQVLLVPPNPTQATVVGITSISAPRPDPASPGSGLLISVKGNVVNLAQDHTVVVVATKRTSTSGRYAFAYADVDRQTGTWEADLFLPKSERFIPSLSAGTMEREKPLASRTDCLPGLCPSEVHRGPTARIENDGPGAKGFENETQPRAVPTPQQSTTSP